MIRSYRDAEARRLMERQASLKYKIVERTALIRLRLLNAATSLGDLRLPGLHLEPLKADRKGQHSIRVNDRYRVCFEWRDGDAYNVEIVDYH
jgi:proteic killer suppression protein